MLAVLLTYCRAASCLLGMPSCIYMLLACFKASLQVIAPLHFLGHFLYTLFSISNRKEGISFFHELQSRGLVAFSPCILFLLCSLGGVRWSWGHEPGIPHELAITHALLSCLLEY